MDKSFIYNLSSTSARSAVRHHRKNSKYSKSRPSVAHKRTVPINLDNLDTLKCNLATISILNASHISDVNSISGFTLAGDINADGYSLYNTILRGGEADSLVIGKFEPSPYANITKLNSDSATINDLTVNKLTVVHKTDVELQTSVVRTNSINMQYSEHFGINTDKTFLGSHNDMLRWLVEGKDAPAQFGSITTPLIKGNDEALHLQTDLGVYIDAPHLRSKMLIADVIESDNSGTDDIKLNARCLVLNDVPIKTSNDHIVIDNGLSTSILIAPVIKAPTALTIDVDSLFLKNGIIKTGSSELGLPNKIRIGSQTLSYENDNIHTPSLRTDALIVGEQSSLVERDGGVHCSSKFSASEMRTSAIKPVEGAKNHISVTSDVIEFLGSEVRINDCHLSADNKQFKINYPLCVADELTFLSESKDSISSIKWTGSHLEMETVKIKTLSGTVEMDTIEISGQQLCARDNVLNVPSFSIQNSVLSEKDDVLNCSTAVCCPVIYVGSKQCSVAPSPSGGIVVDKLTVGSVSLVKSSVGLSIDDDVSVVGNTIRLNNHVVTSTEDDIIIRPVRGIVLESEVVAQNGIVSTKAPIVAKEIMSPSDTLCLPDTITGVKRINGIVKMQSISIGKSTISSNSNILELLSRSIVLPSRAKMGSVELVASNANNCLHIPNVAVNSILLGTATIKERNELLHFKTGGLVINGRGLMSTNNGLCVENFDVKDCLSVKKIMSSGAMNIDVSDLDITTTNFSLNGVAMSADKLTSTFNVNKLSVSELVATNVNVKELAIGGGSVKIFTVNDDIIARANCLKVYGAVNAISASMKSIDAQKFSYDNVSYMAFSNGKCLIEAPLVAKNGLYIQDSHITSSDGVVNIGKAGIEELNVSKALIGRALLEEENGAVKTKTIAVDTIEPINDKVSIPKLKCSSLEGEATMEVNCPDKIELNTPNVRIPTESSLSLGKSTLWDKDGLSIKNRDLVVVASKKIKLDADEIEIGELTSLSAPRADWSVAMPASHWSPDSGNWRKRKTKGMVRWQCDEPGVIVGVLPSGREQHEAVTSVVLYWRGSISNIKVVITSHKTGEDENVPFSMRTPISIEFPHPLAIEEHSVVSLIVKGEGKFDGALIKYTAQAVNDINGSRWYSWRQWESWGGAVWSVEKSEGSKLPRWAWVEESDIKDEFSLSVDLLEGTRGRAGKGCCITSIWIRYEIQENDISHIRPIVWLQSWAGNNGKRSSVPLKVVGTLPTKIGSYYHKLDIQGLVKPEHWLKSGEFVTVELSIQKLQGAVLIFDGATVLYKQRLF
jgi:hypothetical protein